MCLDLKDRIVFITGASRGLGEAIAIEFAKAGADLVLISRNQSALDTVAHSIKRKYRVNILPLSTDITIKKEIERTIEEVLRVFGKIDVLVNNAGVTVKKDFFEVSEKDWDYVLNINLKGAYLCSQVVGKQLIKQKYGKVINMASIGSQLALVHSSAYCASKGGLLQLTRALAVEWAPYNVNVNAIAPGYIETDMVREVMKKKAGLKKGIINRTPMGRLGKPEEISPAVVFLASDAASYITGTVLLIDGGMSALGI